MLSIIPFPIMSRLRMRTQSLTKSEYVFRTPYAHKWVVWDSNADQVIKFMHGFFSLNLPQTL